MLQRTLGHISGGILAAALLTGCAKEEIRSYVIPKEATPQFATMGEHTHEKPHLHFDTPEGWEEIAPGGSMHAASFIIKEGDAQARLNVTPLPGASDIELEAFNMWRGELQLPELSAEELAQQTEPVKIGEASGRMMQMVEATAGGDLKPRGTLGVIGSIEGTLWVFKLTGDQGAVAANKEKLKRFLSTLDIHSSSHDAPAVAHEDEEDSESSGLPGLKTPEGWQSKRPGPVVLAAWDVSSQGGSAEVTITKLGGEGGSLGSNIDRWRGQLGLGPLDPSELPKVTSRIEGATPITLVDLSGKSPRTGKEARMLTAIVRVGGSSWFYKLMGDPAAVAGEKDKFIQFVQSAKYSHAG